AVPATVAVVEGEVRVGLDEADLEALGGNRTRPEKISLRDLAPAVARGATGGTTVAATAHIAAGAGIRVFATGGLGGVHLGARDTWDVSADVLALREAPVVVVCSGVKSILDVGATLEALESSSVALAAYRSDTLPGFLVADTGIPAPWRLDTPEEVAAAFVAARELDHHGALVLANPPDPALALRPEEHDDLLRAARDEAAARGITGKAVTPFLLSEMARRTEGRTLTVNKDLVVRNASLAADIAAAVAHPARGE
ncbi:MAG: pseudouridine-5'-phosphate glycosidase, partial [Actinomycetota bacterium]